MGRLGKIAAAAAVVAAAGFAGLRTPDVGGYATMAGSKVVVDKQLLESPAQYAPVVRLAFWALGPIISRVVSLDVDDLLAAARGRAGLGPDARFWLDTGGGEALRAGAQSDREAYAGTFWLTRLEALSRDLRGPAAPYLSPLGRIMLRESVVDALAVQLRTMDLLARHAAEIEAERVERPIVIAGMPRAMTTHAQSILGRHPGTRTLLFYEGMAPLEPAGVAAADLGTPADPRFKLTGVAAWLMEYMRPLFPLMFRIGADLPTEDIDLMAVSFGSPRWDIATYTPEYTELWHESADNTPAYRMLLLLQRVMQWQDRRRGVQVDGKRWLMKTPEHSAFLKDLMTVYPDAMVILNHRDPVPAVKSFIPMVTYVAGFWNSWVDAELFARYNLGMLSSRLKRMVKEVGSIPRGQVLHIPFRRFVDDNLGVVWEMARFAGLPETDEARDALAAYVAVSPRQGAAKLEYRIDTLGLDGPQLRREFAPYIETFGEWV